MKLSPDQIKRLENCNLGNWSGRTPKLALYMSAHPKLQSWQVAQVEGWANTVCHAPFMYHERSAKYLQCRYSDSTTKIWGDKSVSLKYITNVYKQFGKWIDCSFDEMVNKFPGEFYLRIETAKVPGSVFLGIANCMRGIEEQCTYAIAYHIIREEYPQLNEAQALVLSHITNPPEYSAVYRNENHAVWTSRTTINLNQLTDFGFLDGVVNTCMSFAENPEFSSSTDKKGVYKSSNETMLPNGSYTAVITSPFQQLIPKKEQKNVFYNSTRPVRLDRGSIAYYLESNATTLKGIEITNEADSTW